MWSYKDKEFHTEFLQPTFILNTLAVIDSLFALHKEYNAIQFK
jgi:hypothetical protein